MGRSLFHLGVLYDHFAECKFLESDPTRDLYADWIDVLLHQFTLYHLLQIYSSDPTEEKSPEDITRIVNSADYSRQSREKC